MYYEPKWEQIGTTTTYRMKVPSGWLVLDSVAVFKAGLYSAQSCTLCYVPDPGHDWVFEPEEEPEDE